MAVIRVNKTGDYTVMSNSHFRERDMSLKAKGLLSLMLSLPDSWDYSVEGLSTLCKDGRGSILGALQELEQFGYLTRQQATDEKGRFAGYDYDIYEHPQTEKPLTENPSTDKPLTENPQQLNTKESIPKKSNTEEYKYIVGRLNEKAGTAYKATSKATQTLIKARLSEGFTVDDFYTVIEKKCAEWKGSDMEKYLRPETLFGNKFESYLNAPVSGQKRQKEKPNEYDDFMAKLAAMRD